MPVGLAEPVPLGEMPVPVANGRLWAPAVLFVIGKGAAAAVWVGIG